MTLVPSGPSWRRFGWSALVATAGLGVGVFFRLIGLVFLRRHRIDLGAIADTGKASLHNHLS